MSSTSRVTEHELRSLLAELLDIAYGQMFALHSEFCVSADHNGVMDECEPRIAQIRDRLESDACVWGHPFIPENSRMVTTDGKRYRACKHCGVCRSRAQRRGTTLAEYYEAVPEAREYKGFPVAGAAIGSPDACNAPS